MIHVKEFSLKKVKWNYLGEGNRHLVISLPEKNLVLRFCKYLDDNSDLITEIEECRRYHLIFLFHYTLICPLFGNLYGSLPVIGKLSLNEIGILNSALSNRPNCRKNKSIKYGYVEILPNNALLLMPDYNYKSENINLSEIPIKNKKLLDYMKHILNRLSDTYNFTGDQDNSTFCVEIKPKQGWVPAVDKIFPKCGYCVNQYMKYYNKKIDTITNYCPLDFFSGDIHRMKYAFQCLLENPQNNLKIFKAGKLIYGEGVDLPLDNVVKDIFDENASNIDMFCTLIVDALISGIYNTADDVSVNINPVNVKSNSDSYLSKYFNKISELSKIFSTLKSCNWNFNSLPNNCILQKIINIQKLDNSGLESVYSYYKDHYESNLNYDYIEKLAESCVHNEGKFSLSLDIVQSYLLSVVARDCSIFITFKKISCENEALTNILNCGDYRFIFNISMADIGPKPVSCIEKHVFRNINILNTCSLYFNLR